MKHDGELIKKIYFIEAPQAGYRPSVGRRICLKFDVKQTLSNDNASVKAIHKALLA